jgi:hypothetical protein
MFKRFHISSFPPVSRGAVMAGDLCQTQFGARAVSAQLRAESAHNPQAPAESELREHVVFHVYNDYAGLQAQHFKVRKQVAD